PSAVFIAPHSATVGKNAGLFNRALPISPIGGNDSPLTAVRRDANPFRTAALHNSRPARPARAARRTDTRARFPAVSARKDWHPEIDAAWWSSTTRSAGPSTRAPAPDPNSLRAP